jgi:hypothetical protein
VNTFNRDYWNKFNRELFECGKHKSITPLLDLIEEDQVERKRVCRQMYQLKIDEQKTKIDKLAAALEEIRKGLVDEVHEDYIKSIIYKAFAELEKEA